MSEWFFRCRPRWTSCFNVEKDKKVTKFASYPLVDLVEGHTQKALAAGWIPEILGRRLNRNVGRLGKPNLTSLMIEMVDGTVMRWRKTRTLTSEATVAR